MKKIFIILLVLCSVFSFSLTSSASYSTGEYEVIFKTKASYENTEYEDTFSDHRNFLDAGMLEAEVISGVHIYGAVYDVNSEEKLPCYILRASIGFGSIFDAAEICEELINSGIAQWAVFMRLGASDGLSKTLAFSGKRLVKLSADTLGDIDCNETVDAKDARTALRISVGLEDGKNYPYLMGDMNYDGEITAFDAREILRTSVGLL